MALEAAHFRFQTFGMMEAGEGLASLVFPVSLVFLVFLAFQVFEAFPVVGPVADLVGGSWVYPDADYLVSLVCPVPQVYHPH